jgi:hypothetical protein
VPLPAQSAMRVTRKPRGSLSHEAQVSGPKLMGVSLLRAGRCCRSSSSRRGRWGCSLRRRYPFTYCRIADSLDPHRNAILHVWRSLAAASSRHPG